MLSVKNFVFNPFMENTLVVYDETLEAAIVDCGCLYDTERRELKKFIDDLEDIAKVDNAPKLEGKRMIVNLSPKPKK